MHVLYFILFYFIGEGVGRPRLAIPSTEREWDNGLEQLF